MVNQYNGPTLLVMVGGFTRVIGYIFWGGKYD